MFKAKTISKKHKESLIKFITLKLLFQHVDICYRRLVPTKFVDVLVRMLYFLAVKYEHKLRGEYFSA